MKKMKKVMALLLSLVMVLAMSIATFATETTSGFKITAPNNGHTYEVYQIFTGDLSTEDGVQILSNLKWGKNGKGGTADTAVNADVISALNNVKGQSDTNILAVVANYVNLDKTKVFGTVSNATALNVPAGYYLIKDVDGAFTNEDDSYTKYIVKVAENITIDPKSDKPSVEKKVQENVKTENTTGGYGDRYNDTADYNIGDAVPFKLIGTVPDMSQYAKYKYTFHDTLSKAFNAPTEEDIKVYVASKKAGTDKKLVTDGFTTNIATDVDTGITTITVSTDDLKTIKYTKGTETATEVQKGDYILVEYSAVLNENASIESATPGNTNEVYLTYSNNPNQGGNGIPEEGKTPVDKVIVFTYKLDAEKVDGQDANKKLENVTFRVYRKTASNEKEWAKVTDGKLSGWTKEENEATTLSSDKDGKFSVAGLDDGNYYIKEVQQLPGYNKLTEDVEVAIVANTSNGQSGAGEVSELKWVKLIDKNNIEGTVVTIKNNKGTNLPTTGGMGTTIFYVVGSILVLGAAILLITKKRMSAR